MTFPINRFCDGNQIYTFSFRHIMMHVCFRLELLIHEIKALAVKESQFRFAGATAGSDKADILKGMAASLRHLAHAAAACRVRRL